MPPSRWALAFVACGMSTRTSENHWFRAAVRASVSCGLYVTEFVIVPHPLFPLSHPPLPHSTHIGEKFRFTGRLGMKQRIATADREWDKRALEAGEQVAKYYSYTKTSDGASP